MAFLISVLTTSPPNLIAMNTGVDSVAIAIVGDGPNERTCLNGNAGGDQRPRHRQYND